MTTSHAPTPMDAPSESTSSAANLAPPGPKKPITFLTLPAEIRQQIIFESFAPTSSLITKRKSEFLRAAKAHVETWADTLKEVFDEDVGASMVGDLKADVDFVAKGMIDVVLESALKCIEVHEKKIDEVGKLMKEFEEKMG